MDPAATNPSSLSATVHRDAKLRQHQHEHKHKRQPRILFVLFLSTLFFLLELIVGEMTGSVALVADSFHMISDVLALVISLYGIRFAKQSGPNKKSTYGWQRAEQLGVLVNGVFLLALIFTIIVEAIQRLFSPQGTTPFCIQKKFFLLLRNQKPRSCPHRRRCWLEFQRFWHAYLRYVWTSQGPTLLNFSHLS